MQEEIILETKNLMENSLNLYKNIINKINFNLNDNFIDFINIKEKTKNLKLKDISYIKKNEKGDIIIEPINKIYIKNIYEKIKDFEPNLNIINLGKVLKIFNDPIDREKKLKLVKLIKQETENYKINIRNIRKIINNKIKKNKINNIEIKIKEIQNLTDIYIKQINQIYLEKIKNLN